MNTSQDQLAVDEADRAAIENTLSGDRNAFGEIVHRYSGPMYSLAFQLCSQPEEAEEAVQEIFSRVFRALPQYRTENRFFSWLYSIAVNYLRSQNKSRKKRDQKVTVQFPVLTGGIPAESDFGSPENTAVRHAAHEAVMQALQMIPIRYREVFVLRHVEELSSKDTAEILDVPENTVKTNLRRARKKLADILVKRGWS
ncbi:RNA polymerase sigma factor [Spirochaeta dissipatitropha]